MSEHQRPWWLFINRPKFLDTEIEERNSPGEQLFIVTGQPNVQNLGGLTWGPIAALIIIALMTALAIILDIREQSLAMRGLYIIAFLLLPAMGWGLATLLFNKVAGRYLADELAASTQRCQIRLDYKAGELSYQKNGQASERTLSFGEIEQARLTHPIGQRNVKLMRLTLETADGPITLLDEKLGTQVQKMDLLEKIQQALEAGR